jgi:hypothetical protein
MSGTDRGAQEESGRVMNKSQAIWLFLTLFACAAAYAGRESDKTARTLIASRITSPPTQISVGTANAYIRTANAEAKMTRDLMKKWADHSNAATSLEQLKQIAIDEDQAIDLAIQHNKKSTELMDIVKASLPSSCVESVSIIYKMVSEDLAVEVEMKNLTIQSDISTAEGLNRFNAALAKLAAREHAIIDEKNAYEGSAAYRNACGPND